MKLSRVILTFILLTAVIAIPPAILLQTGNNSLIDANFWSLFGFMSLVTFALIIVMSTLNVKRPQFFAQGFLICTTVKILACFIFIFIFVHNNKPNKTIFMADFFYTYILNTGFEVYVLLRNLRHKKLR
jgi:hypothetical protein